MQEVHNQPKVCDNHPQSEFIRWITTKHTHSHWSLFGVSANFAGQYEGAKTNNTQESLSPLLLFPDCLRMYNCAIPPATGGRKKSTNLCQIYIFSSSLFSAFLCRTSMILSSVCRQRWDLCLWICTKLQSTWAWPTHAPSMLTWPSRCWVPEPAWGMNSKPQTVLLPTLTKSPMVLPRCVILFQVVQPRCALILSVAVLLIWIVPLLCRCVMQSKSIADNVKLSLDLTHRGAVSQCLQNYLKISCTSAHFLIFFCAFNHNPLSCLLLLFSPAEEPVGILLQVLSYSGVITAVVHGSPKVSNIISNYSAVKC